MPPFLKNLRIWCVTEHSCEPTSYCRVPAKGRLSPITLSNLRPDRHEDYSDYRTATQAVEEHPHWLGGVGIRVLPPLLVIVVRYCFQPSGKLDKSVRELMKGLSGYWERSPLREDVWGVIWSPTPVVGTEGWFHGNRALVYTEAHLNLTGETFRGVSGDPGPTNHERLAQFLKEIH